MVFSGILLILVGLFDVVNGIRAIGAQDTAFDAIFWDNNIEAWGWFYLVLGVVLLVAGIAIFGRARWADAGRHRGRGRRRCAEHVLGVRLPDP